MNFQTIASSRFYFRLREKVFFYGNSNGTVVSTENLCSREYLRSYSIFFVLNILLYHISRLKIKRICFTPICEANSFPPLGPNQHKVIGLYWPSLKQHSSKRPHFQGLKQIFLIYCLPTEFPEAIILRLARRVQFLNVSMFL